MWGETCSALIGKFHFPATRYVLTKYQLCEYPFPLLKQVPYYFSNNTSRAAPKMRSSSFNRQRLRRVGRFTLFIAATVSSQPLRAAPRKRHTSPIPVQAHPGNNNDAYDQDAAVERVAAAGGTKRKLQGSPTCESLYSDFNAETDWAEYRIGYEFSNRLPNTSYAAARRDLVSNIEDKVVKPAVAFWQKTLKSRRYSTAS